MSVALEIETKDAGDSVRLDFVNLTYTISGRHGSKEILKNVSGSCQPGRNLAIMGRSGAGKTTLLDILACNGTEGAVTGEVLVNGQPRQRAQFRKMSCYVMQKDVLLPTATVRESLITSALLRLPYKLATAEKLQRVDAILAELGLNSCQHVLIGDETLGRKGISGGQRRRLSIGIEMVTNPRVIFLDEPTSGLDSDSAYAIVNSIKELSRRQRTVVFTIHQPSSNMVDLFDDFMLMAMGRCCYHGPWQEAVNVIAGWGYACPAFKNPTDFYMNLTKDEGVCCKLAASCDRYIQEQQATSSSPGPHLLPTRTDTQLQSNSCHNHSFPVSSTRALNPQLSFIQERTKTALAPTWYQVAVLSKRFALSWWRDPMLFSSEAFQYVVFGVFIGLMYLQVTDSGSRGAFQRVSAIWFTLTAMSFTPAVTAMVTWERERLLLRRESAMQAYSSWSFFTAKTLVTWPVELALAAFMGALVYFMVGLQPVVSKFFLWLLVLLMFQLTSESIGTICALITPSVAYANLILSVVMIFMLSFTGFLTQGIPIYFKWVQSISYLNYAYISMVDMEFTDLKLRDSEGQLVDARMFIPPGSTNELSLSGNILLVFGLMVFTRVLALVLLNVAIKWRWL